MDDGLICLGLLVIGAVPLLSLIIGFSAAFSASRANRRIGDLEQRLAEAETQLARMKLAGNTLRSSVVVAPDASPVSTPPVATPIAPPTPVTTPVATPIAPPTPVAPSVATPPPPPPVSTVLPGTTDAPSENTAPKPATPAASPPPAPPAPKPSSPPLSPEKIALWVLAIAGGGLFLLAALFAFREAVAAGWVGPGARFALGVLAGVGAWGIGEVLWSRKYTVPGGALVGAGSAVLYGALYAGIARYGLLSQPVAFGAMIAVTVVTMMAAVHHRSRFQAALGAVGGYMTPVLLSTGENAALAFFAYLSVLNVGILVAARRRDWWDQVLLAGAITPLLYLGWAATWRGPDQVGVGLAGAFMLSLVFGMASGGGTVAVRGATAVASLAMALAGGVMVWPADPQAVDPITSRMLEWSMGQTVWIALGYVFLQALQQTLLQRRWKDPKEHLLGSGFSFATGAGISLLLAAFAGGWLGAGEPRWVPVLVGLVGMPFGVGLLGGTGGLALPMVFATSVLCGMGGVGVLDGPAAPEPGPVLILALGLGLQSAGLFRWKGPFWALPLGAVAGPLVLIALGVGIQESLGPALLTTVVLYSVWFYYPFLRSTPDHRAGVMAAALVGPAVFLPLRQLWLGAWGEGFLGLLPLLLGLNLLMAVVVSVRRRLFAANSLELAVLAGLAMLAAAVAVPLQLDREWLTVGWAVELALLGTLHQRIRHPLLVSFAMVLALAVTMRLLFNPEAYSYGGGSGWIILNWTLYTWGLPAVCFLAAASLFSRTSVPVLPTLLRVVSVVLLFVLVNLEVSHAFAHDGALSFSGEGLAQGMTRSLSWAAYGLALIVVGSIWESRWTRLVGLLFALLGVAKVCVWDLWALSGFYRVGSLAGLAIAMLLAAIAFQRLVLRDRSKS